MSTLESQGPKQAQLALNLIKIALSSTSNNPGSQQALIGLSKAQKALEIYLKNPAELVQINVAYEVLGAAREDLKKAGEAKALEAVTRGMTALHPIAESRKELEQKDKDLRAKAARPPELPSMTPKAPGEERRAAPRVFLDAEVSFESESNFYTGFTSDLSDGGIFIATYNLRPVGTVIELSFGLPNGHVINAKGIVRWVRDPKDETLDAPPGVGLQFQDLKNEDRQAILDFVKAREPLFYDE